MSMELKPLHKDIGAEVTGIDIGKGVDAATAAAVRGALLENLVLVFPDQDISETAQEEFCRHFGELEVVRSAVAQDSDHPSILLITNVRDTGKVTALEDGEMMFHYDQCYYEHPCLGSTLFALEVPKDGGHTLFTSCYAAYDRLSDAWKKRLEGLKALNYYDYNRDPTIRPEKLNPDAPQYVHPVVRTHPETGRKALFVNRLMTIRIEGMDPDESDEILDYLFDVVEDPDYVYEHRWSVGEMLMWDNRCSIHARTFFPPEQRRMMRRITIKDPSTVV